jgi:hypothetical protein
MSVLAPARCLLAPITATHNGKDIQAILSAPQESAVKDGESIATQPRTIQGDTLSELERDALISRGTPPKRLPVNPVKSSHRS